MGAIIPATIPGVPGLSNALQNKNWQVIAGTGMNLSDNSATNNLQIQTTTRGNIIPAYSGTHLVLAFANYAGASGGVGEVGGNSTPKIHCTIEPSSIGSETTITSNRQEVTFSNGQSWKPLDQFGISYSDPIPFNFTAGVPFFIWVDQSVGGFAVTHLGGYFTRGGTAPGNSANGEAWASTVMYASGGTPTQQQSTDGLMPCAILGYVPGSVKSAGIMGDSIADNTEDGGMGYNNGGYCQRSVSNQTNLVYTYPVTPAVGYLKVCKGGETLALFTYNNYQNSKRRVELLMLCSTIICEMGTNDIANGTTLATMKALYLANANYFLAAGKKFVGCTILPRVVSTDGFATTANQTPIASESVRTGFNSWLRDKTPSGFTQQANLPSMVSIFDAAASVEVNSSNTLTLNGGYWFIRGTAIYSGTLTTVTNLSTLADSGNPKAQDFYRGNYLLMTSGVAAQTGADIYSNTLTSGVYNLGSASTGLSQLPSIGDSYSIFSNMPTVDGIHPTGYTHNLIANASPSLVSLVS